MIPMQRAAASLQSDKERSRGFKQFEERFAHINFENLEGAPDGRGGGTDDAKSWKLIDKVPIKARKSGFCAK
jgi:hypothetical protein